MADAARLAAYDVLKAVRVDDEYANLALPGILQARGLTGRDAAFATELAAGTLRGQGTYDVIIDACLAQGRVQPRIRDVLRLGAHQLLAMRVPSHAAVSASVDLARLRTGPRSIGLVNAVLRKVAARDLDAWVAELAPDPATDPTGHLALAHAHPRWIVEALAEAVGVDEVEALLAADNAAPRVTLVARPGLARREELPGTPTTLSPYGVVLEGGDPREIPAVAEGRAGVQDEGSQLVALALADAPLEGRDQRWLDLCAGPGGKTALLAALAAQRGATVLANDLQEHRARLVSRSTRATTAGLLGVVCADATRPAWPDSGFDRVLVDAPCTGLGALRRRPEARWRRTPADLDALVPLQRRILAAALDAVRPGGVVAYATCSPVLAETDGVVTATLRERPDATLVRTERWWPHRHGTDAMFVALLTRTSPNG